MERDFELEYRELKQNETPDLWNRIEAGLSEKKIAAVPSENESKSIDIEHFVMKKQTTWKRWGLLAAACLCVVIIIPAVMAGLIGSSKSTSSGSADTAAGAADMNTSSSAAASAELSEAFDTAPAEAAAEEGKAEPEYTESTTDDAGSSMAGGSETAAMEDTEASEEEAAEAAAPEISDGQILEGAVVQILQADETGEETVFQAVVLEAETDAVMESGMQIELICNDETQYDFIREPREEKGLKKEEIYEVSLQYEQDRFVVLTAA